MKSNNNNRRERERVSEVYTTQQFRDLRVNDTMAGGRLQYSRLDGYNVYSRYGEHGERERESESEPIQTTKSVILSICID